MSGIIEPPELVEDPDQPKQSSAKEDRAREERGHGPQEVGPAYSDTDDADNDLVSVPRVCLIVSLPEGSNGRARSFLAVWYVLCMYAMLAPQYVAVVHDVV